MREVNSEKYKTFKVESWRDFDDFDPKSPQCVYRGQGKASWPLQTAYERKQGVQNPMREQGMLQQFISQAGVYMKDFPPKDDFISWFALMQHHGAGTRLLDVTRSKYIALFFALAGMIDSGCEEDGAVWVFKTLASNTKFFNAIMTTRESPCIDTRNDSLTQPLAEYKTLGARFGNEFIRSDWCGEIRKGIEDEFVLQHRERMKPFLENGGVMRVVPAKSNNRMVAQAAEFLMPITLRKSFEDNLKSCTDCNPEVVKLIVPIDQVRVMLEKLQEMNINYQTLYPDINGLALAMNM